jgi:hypothetical protein
VAIFASTGLNNPPRYSVRRLPFNFAEFPFHALR